jgi:hypothetical protein
MTWSLKCLSEYRLEDLMNFLDVRRQRSFPMCSFLDAGLTHPVLSLTYFILFTSLVPIHAYSRNHASLSCRVQVIQIR